MRITNNQQLKIIREISRVNHNQRNSSIKMLSHNIFHPRKKVWMKVDITVQINLTRSFNFCLRCRQGFLTTLRLV